jgi:hypothetical protein
MNAEGKEQDMNFTNRHGFKGKIINGKMIRGRFNAQTQGRRREQTSEENLAAIQT